MGNSLSKKNEDYYNFCTSIVVAIIDNQDQARSAYAALTRTAFADDAVELFYGPEGEQELDLKGERHGRFQHLMRKLQHMLVTTQGLEMDYYENELAAGSSILWVRTDFHNRKQAQAIMKSNGGRYINFYGLLTNEGIKQLFRLYGRPICKKLASRNDKEQQLASIQAPKILMSQNRQSVKDRLGAAHDYQVNLKGGTGSLESARKDRRAARKQMGGANYNSAGANQIADAIIEGERGERHKNTKKLVLFTKH